MGILSSMLIVGLTGGIGSGKSTIAHLFSELGVPVVDADRIARDLVAPGQPALEAIARQFGARLIDAEGRLKRDALRRIVFAEPGRRKALEAILHPRIKEAMRRHLAQVDSPYCIAVIPLLVEADQRDLVHRVLVVDTPTSLQYERVRRRDGLSDEEIGAIIRSQADRQKRLAAADDVVSNAGGLDDLKREVNDLHRYYSGLGGESADK